MLLTTQQSLVAAMDVVKRFIRVAEKRFDYVAASRWKQLLEDMRKATESETD